MVVVVVRRLSVVLQSTAACISDLKTILQDVFFELAKMAVS